MNGLDLLAPEHRGLFIAGQWRDAGNGARLDVLDPADGSVLTDVADGTLDDARAALDAAVAAQTDWGRTAPRERGEVLRRAYDLVQERADDLAHLMSLEMGKTVAEARGEVAYGSEFLRWFSEEAVRIHGRWMTAPAGGSRLLTMQKPVGPVLLITPWNFPLAMGTRKIGPAIAAGCTMVVKPAAQTPLTMLALAAILEEAGVPAGVLNVVTTSGSRELSETLQADDRLRKVSFTGSTGVGRTLVRQSADNLQRLSMELGGNAPFLVFEDADPAHAAKGAALVKLLNTGQACISPNRLYVHRSLKDEFLRVLTDRVERMRVGSGHTEGVTVGPLIDEESLERMERQVADAVDRGATLLTGGQRVRGEGVDGGWFYAPTVLDGVTPDMRIYREETFGPLAPVVVFDTEQEAVAMANDTAYGLASYVYTRDLSRALRVAEALRFGMVGINDINPTAAAAPFGGMKESGLGREGAHEGILEYLETKLVGIAL
jgi:succinate-semialdehyde dehydrogenase/glutarate-semialdehyde dehydrogenase